MNKNNRRMNDCQTIYKACKRMNCRQDFKVKCRNCALFTQLMSNLWIQLTKRIFARLTKDETT